jgi:hypothetical protein
LLLQTRGGGVDSGIDALAYRVRSGRPHVDRSTGNGARIGALDEKNEGAALHLVGPTV